MCGIVGIFDFEQPVDRDLVRAMNSTIVHRGPNDEGYHFDGSVGLGVRRLSIIDIEGGHQPIHDEHESVWLVFNGEIYNYRELRPDLERAGHTFYTSSDTETIVHLYEDKDVDCLTHLNGMFAFALWDRARRRLLIARDRLGVKPLYYYADDRRLCFASELKALLQCPFVPREPDRAALADYLALMYIPAPATPFRGIRKLLPGHYLTCQDGRMTTKPWWALADHCEPTSLGRADAEEQIRALLKDSVRLRLRSDVPVGSFLSGGVDSTSIAFFASQQLDRPLETFCVGFPADGINELEFAGIAARAFRTSHHELEASLEDVKAHLPKLVWHLDEPNADSAILPTYLVSRLAGQTMRVILSGLGGDELFGGYHRYFAGSSLREMYRSVPDPIRGAIRPIAKALAPSVHAKLARVEESPQTGYLRSIRMFSDEEIDALLGGSSGASGALARLGGEFAAYPGRDRANRLMFVDHHTYLPDDILALTDRMSMAASLEARTPFLDYRLVEFAASLPGSWKIQGSDWKIVLKQAMAPLLPSEIVTRGKWGFGGPVKSWMNKGLGDELGSYAREGALVDHGVFDRAAFEGIVRASKVNGVWVQAQKLWALLVLELWCQAFLQPARRAAVANA